MAASNLPELQRNMFPQITCQRNLASNLGSNQISQIKANPAREIPCLFPSWEFGVFLRSKLTPS